jgi:hypothetical protein
MMDHVSCLYSATGFNIVLYVMMSTLKDIHVVRLAQLHSD